MSTQTTPKTRARATAPRSESLLDQLHRLLDESVGLHWRMSKEAGVSQTVVSRTYLRQGEPRLSSAEKMLAWLNANRERFDQLRAEGALRAAEARYRGRVPVPRAAVRKIGKARASARAA